MDRIEIVKARLSSCNRALLAFILLDVFVLVVENEFVNEFGFVGVIVAVILLASSITASTVAFSLANGAEIELRELRRQASENLDESEWTTPAGAVGKAMNVYDESIELAFPSGVAQTYSRKFLTRHLPEVVTHAVAEDE